MHIFFRHISRAWGCCLLLHLFAASAFAQSAADTLKEVEITTRKATNTTDEKLKTFTPGQKKITIDSIALLLYANESIAQLLYQKAPVFIKSYGFNGLATLNLRGSSAAQSQVLWNGIPIQNAALGIADISTLPVAAIDKVHIVYGSSSALFGSGNVGGAILLENGAPVFDSAMALHSTISLGMGSFQQYRAGIKTTVSTRRLAISLQLFGQYAKNDFRYTDEQDSSRQQTNARLSSGTGLVSVAWQPTAKDVLRLHGWLQEYNREIPPALFESASQKQRKDQSQRIMLDWQHSEQQTNYSLKTAYIHDALDYEDSLTSLYTNSNTHQLFSEAGVRKKLWQKLDVQLFAPLQIASLTDDTGAKHQQTKIALALATDLKLWHNNIDMATNLRQEWINGQPVFTLGTNERWTINHWASLSFNLQKTYRVPTLNELYYTPSGNTSLKPEHGWAEDLSLNTVNNLSRRTTLKQELSFYNRNIQDWIIWYGGAIWTPHNVATVQSRGIEYAEKLCYQLVRAQLFLNSSISYTSARTRQSYQPNDGSIGRQLPYTPKWQGLAELGIRTGQFLLSYTHVYTGIRYITTDESQSLPYYHTGNINVLYSPVVAGRQCSMSFQLNNLLNKQYTVVAGRVMPGRYFLLGLSIKDLRKTLKVPK